MSETPFPLLVEPEELHPRLGDEQLLLVDVGRAATYEQAHLPGARHLDYGAIVAATGQAGGLLPDEIRLGAALSAIGLTPERHVVAYDDEGGGKAARLLWTLEALGHRRYSLLNGGLHAWAGERRPLTTAIAESTASDYRAKLADDSAVVASRAFILEHLNDPNVALLDARSPSEYDGSRRYAARGGHIPGAVNMEWTEAMDQGRNLRLRDADWLRQRLAALGIRPEQTVVAYCQTHHRSAHTWFWLKWIGRNAKGYPGSWSDWGNREDVPVEGG